MRIRVDKDQYIALIKEVERLKRVHKVILSEDLRIESEIKKENKTALTKAVLEAYKDIAESESQKRGRLEDVLKRYIDERLPILIEKALAEDKYKDMILAKVVRASIGMDK